MQSLFKRLSQTQEDPLCWGYVVCLDIVGKISRSCLFSVISLSFHFHISTWGQKWEWVLPHHSFSNSHSPPLHWCLVYAAPGKQVYHVILSYLYHGFILILSLVLTFTLTTPSLVPCVRCSRLRQPESIPSFSIHVNNQFISQWAVKVVKYKEHVEAENK